MQGMIPGASRWGARILLLVGLGVTAVACGSTAAADLFGSTDGGSASDGGALTDGGAADGGAGGDGGGGKDGGKRDGAATDASVVDAAPVGERLACSPRSGNTCDLATQTCCRTVAGTACQSPQATCNGMDIPCAEARDCVATGQPGTLCCASFNDQNRVDGVSCRPTSDCVVDQGYVVVCDPAESDPCPNGGKCTLSTVTFPGFYLCIP